MIHPTAVIDAGARIDDGAEVGPYSIIGPDVEIGAGTHIGAHVVLKGPTRIGLGNRIFPFATIGEDTPDLKYRGEPTRLVIGNDNVIREGVTIHRGTMADRGETLIGHDNLFMAYVHIGHDSVVGNHTILVNNSALAGHTYLGDWAILSGYTLIHQRCRVGAHAFTGAATYLTQDLPAYVLATGNPAAAIGINVEGLKRRGFSHDSITAIKQAYRIVYRQGLILEEALQVLRPMCEAHPELELFLATLRASNRGIVR